MDERSLETIGMELAILHRRLASFTTYRKKIGNLDHSAYLLLEQITTYGSAGVKALADEFHLDISTVSRQATTLEKKGYVCRIPDPVDRRAYSLQITALGTTELNEYKRLRMLKMAELLHNWSDTERKMFGELLNKFNRTFI
jgi:DNA-binding MarR family transcriptional regulator